MKSQVFSNFFPVVLLSLFGAVFTGCSGKDAVSAATVWENPREIEKSFIEGVTVARDILVDEINTSGLVEGVREAMVVSEAQGIIQELMFSLGTKVKKGEVLLKVEDAIPKATMEKNREAYESARIELEGTERVFASGGASVAALAKVRSTASAAKAQFEIALKAYQDCTVRAPIDGFIALRDPVITVGNFLNAGTRIARIVDLSSFQIEISVGEREVGLILPGDKAQVIVPAACPDRSIQGEVKAVAAGSDPRTGSYSVLIGWRDNCGGLIRSGMSASVTVKASRAEPVVVIPTAALVKREGRYGVFVEKDGRAEVRTVSIGRRSGVRTEILSGLAPGDLLLVSGLSRLRPGNPVQAKNLGTSTDWD